jgi:hypothetical protein
MFGVGSNSHDRDLRTARAAYIGAVRRLDTALREFDASDIPMDPGPGPEPRPWTRLHVEMLRATVAAFAAVLESRRHWDRLRREWAPPH